MTLVTEDIKIISNKAKGNWVLKEYQREKKMSRFENNNNWAVWKIGATSFPA